MIEPPKTLVIDRMIDQDAGWYHEGNMYWTPEHKFFWGWMNKNSSSVEYEDDFPHSYFRFTTPEAENDFLVKWGHLVR